MEDKANTSYYNIAGLSIRVCGQQFDDTGMLTRFRADGADGGVDISVGIETAARIGIPPDARLLHTQAFCEYYERGDERLKAVYLNGTGDPTRLMLLVRYAGNNCTATLANGFLEYFNSRAFFELLELPRVLIENNGFILHASYINTQYGAIAFTAKKQTGKSTQAALWEKHRGAFVVNGDRVALRKTDGVWYACGTPYCGTSKICYNVNVPLRAIVILAQAKENTVGQANAREAMTALLGGATFDVWDGAQMTRAVELFEDVINSVPVIKLACVPDESAVRALEEELCRKTNP